MSYENRFSLKVLVQPTETKSVMKCPTCGKLHDSEAKFCQEDGMKFG